MSEDYDDRGYDDKTYTDDVARLGVRKSSPLPWVQLLLLPHYQHDFFQESRVAPLRHMAVDGDTAVTGVKQTRKDFERGGFARSVGAQKADTRARFNLEINAVDGFHRLGLRHKESSQRRRQPGRPLLHLVVLL